LGTDIDEESTSIIFWGLMNLIEDDNQREKNEVGFKREPIRLFINSGGGYIPHMFSIIDLIQNSKTPIHTICTGYAASAAAILFVSGHERYMFKNSYLMFHSIRQRMDDRFQRIVDTTEFLKKEQKNINKLISSKTKIDKKLLKDIIDGNKDYVMFSDEAVSHGCADKIL
jgi:ATP-dependent Clp protease protease subunit